MRQRQQVLESLNRVVAEHDAARRSVAFLLSHAQRDRSVLKPRDPSMADLRRCLQNLERTYLVRLFALFEESLREIWRRSFGKRTMPRTEHLLNGCAARTGMRPESLLLQTHEVRQFRNHVVHGTAAAVVALADAKSRLCRFFSWMPEQW